MKSNLKIGTIEKDEKKTKYTTHAGVIVQNTVNSPSHECHPSRSSRHHSVCLLISSLTSSIAGIALKVVLTEKLIDKFDGPLQIAHRLKEFVHWLDMN